jgi:hypothetical protein
VAADASAKSEVHKMRNILAKLPRVDAGHDAKPVQQVFLAPTFPKAHKRQRSHREI